MSGLTPESSAIRTTPDIEQRLSECTNSEQIKAIMAEAALTQGLVTPDALNPTVLIPTALADHAPRSFAKAITINGTKHILEAADEAGLVAAETALYKSLFQQDASQEQRRDPATGQFTTQTDKEAEEAEQVRLAEVEQNFKPGQITLNDYIEQSGAGDRVMQKRQQQETSERQDGEGATATFIQNHPEWQGGSDNLRIMMN